MSLLGTNICAQHRLTAACPDQHVHSSNGRMDLFHCVTFGIHRRSAC